MPGPHLLIVDDLVENRRLLCRLIQHHEPEARIETATGGREALALVAEQAESLDVVVLDAMMPEIDGFEVCRRIKQDPGTSGVLVLMVSGQLIESRDRISGLESGADSYLCKPFENPELIAQVRALLRIRRMDRKLRRQNERLERELSERRRIETELQVAKEAAEAADWAKSEFLAHMSHEIRTPMNAVIGMTEILLDAELSEDQEECVRTIHSAGETLLMVINDILDYSKIQSGKLDLEHRPFRLDELVDDAMRLVENQARNKGLALTANLAPGVPRDVIGDTIRLRQILANLLSNAVKFTEKGSVHVEVGAVRLDGRACDLLFSVRDTGIGIASEQLGRLFQSFKQGDASTTRRFGGTGLGLVISQRLARLMGGNVQVESEEGYGTTFHARVRLEVAHADVSEAARLPGVQDKTVLVLDPDADRRHQLMERLASWSVKTVETGDPADALHRLAGDAPPDLVVVEKDLPGMGGSAFARKAKGMAGSTAVPLILLGDGPQTDDGDGDGPAEESARLFVARLTRPTNPSTLFDVLAAELHVPDGVVPAAGAPAQDLGALRVLVVEDNPVNRKVAEMMLARIGCRADMVVDGQAAVEAANRTPYDVILMDVQMPVMDGVEATRCIRAAQASGPRPRIVALTAHAMRGDREKYLAAGMDDYLSKPIREKELRRALEPAGAAGRPGEA